MRASHELPRFRGKLRIAGTQIPVARVELDIFLTSPPGPESSLSLPREWQALPLARARTDRDGAFAFSFATSALPDWASACLENSDAVRLKVTIVGLTALAVSPMPTPRGWTDEVMLEIAYQEPAPARLEALLKSAVAAEVGTVARLAGHIADAEVSDMNLVERAQAVAWLERVFLDPTGALSRITPVPAWRDLRHQGARAAFAGRLERAVDRPSVAAALAALEAKIEAFESLTQVDWPIDLVESPAADKLGALIQTAAEKFSRIPPGETVELNFSPFGSAPSSYVGYRDYLVETWHRYVEAVNRKVSISPKQAADQLNNRFKQTFTTKTVLRSPANKLVIGIVEKILGAPAPPQDLGYGLAPSALPQRSEMSDRAYLDALIAASGVTAGEFSVRHRIDVRRPDAARSSPVEENIATLLQFFRDGFQSEIDPVNASPDHFHAPIVQKNMLQKAPFFLEYEEWLVATAPFYPENCLSLRRMLDTSELRLEEEELKRVPDRAWYSKIPEIMDKVEEGHRAFDRREYAQAEQHYASAWQSARQQLTQVTLPWSSDHELIFARRAQFKVSNMSELLSFETLAQPWRMEDNPTPVSFEDGDPGRQVFWLILYFGAAYYVWVGDALLAQGRMAEAVRHYSALSDITIGAAEFDSPSGPFMNEYDVPDLYQAGRLPYTIDNAKSPRYLDQPDNANSRSIFAIATNLWRLAPGVIATMLHRSERKFIALRLGEAMLAWADVLCRSNDASCTARARELYKGVLWLHGEDPRVGPHWPKDPDPTLQTRLTFFNVRRNPAVVSQTQRSRLALYKIDNNLNVYGYSDTYVPTLRYRALKDSADRFAALAKAAQADYLGAIAALENLTIEELKTTSAVSKALTQLEIAEEQVRIADTNVKLAQQQVQAVQREIDAKRHEVEDKEEFLTQLADFYRGMASTFTGLPFGAGDAIGSSFKSELGIPGGGVSGFWGIGTPATIVGGYAAFVYAGYTTLRSMSDTYNALASQLRTLEDVKMPAARMALGVKESELAIANLSRGIVASDLQFGRELLAYHTSKVLNADFWATMSGVLKRAMQRYLELGAWSGWLAERALAFEQARPVKIMRYDYWPRAVQGLTGPDLLQLDLAELEASRIAGTRAMVPFRHTFSLLVDFPVAFGQLKSAGSCAFVTDEALLRAAYPGTFGHRIDTLSITLSGTQGTLHGVLVNSGVSVASRDDALNPGVLVVNPSALPICEALGNGSLTGEGLRPFEGSGTTTSWQLRLSESPPHPAVTGLLDVLVTMEGRALFSQRLLNMPPKVESRGFMLSGRQIAATEFAKFADAGVDEVKIAFDLPRLLPNRSGDLRRITNVGVLLPRPAGGVVSANLNAEAIPVVVNFQIADGYALSNGDPLGGGKGAKSSLNAVIGTTFEQKLVLGFAKSQNAGIDLAAAVDVILTVEYKITAA